MNTRQGLTAIAAVVVALAISAPAAMASPCNSAPGPGFPGDPTTGPSLWQTGTTAGQELWQIGTTAGQTGLEAGANAAVGAWKTGATAGQNGLEAGAAAGLGAWQTVGNLLFPPQHP